MKSAAQLTEFFNEHFEFEGYKILIRRKPFLRRTSLRVSPAKNPNHLREQGLSPELNPVPNSKPNSESEAFSEILSESRNEKNAKAKTEARTSDVTLGSAAQNFAQTTRGAHIVVTTSLLLPIHEIRAFVALHREWLKKQVLKSAKVSDRFPLARFVEGEVFMILGKQYRLKFLRGQARTWGFDIIKHSNQAEQDPSKVNLPVNLTCQMIDGELLAIVPAAMAVTFQSNSYHPEVLAAYAKFLQALAVEIIPPLTKEISFAAELPYRKLSLRGQRARWGSCTSTGNISLNWKLIIFPIEIIEYVIAHELAHLIHLDHSPRFWQKVAEVHPQYKSSRRWLRQNQKRADFLMV
jgi:predicted metal-dependent hydrolase